jgi:catechol 2,3-dioxygenase-like lactoylglutathione lyase family enzyme
MQTATVGDGATAAGGWLESLTYANTAVVVADLDRVIQWYGRHLGFTERARAQRRGEVALLEGVGSQLEFLQPLVDGSVAQPHLGVERPQQHLLVAVLGEGQ